MDESFDTLVVGGGQAGLATGYFLAQQGKDFLILDENVRTGNSWRKRWDSLRLFTPSQFDGLPGMRFPHPDFYFPSKDEVADYLEAYARAFQLPVRHGVKVEALCRGESGYKLLTGTGSFSARKVIIATGPYRQPSIPLFARQLDPEIFQLHSREYQNPTQVVAEKVLVVGAGTSGVEIALELARAGKQVWLAGRDVGQMPADTLGKAFGGRPYWWLISQVLSEATPIGRKMKSKVLDHGSPLIRTSRRDVAKAGVEFMPRVSRVHSGQPVFEDGQTLLVEAIIWTTGFRPDFSWIDLPIFDYRGLPHHRQGLVQDAPGLSFVGLPFQRALSSTLLGGVGSDAEMIVERLGGNGHTG